MPLTALTETGHIDSHEGSEFIKVFEIAACGLQGGASQGAGIYYQQEESSLQVSSGVGVSL